MGAAVTAGLYIIFFVLSAALVVGLTIFLIGGGLIQLYQAAIERIEQYRIKRDLIDGKYTLRKCREDETRN